MYQRKKALKGCNFSKKHHVFLPTLLKQPFYNIVIPLLKMRKIILLGLYASLIPLAGHSQTNTTQLPNGVVVHQAQGVEGSPEVKKQETVRVRTLQDWTLPECIDGLVHTEMKLNEASGADRERYLIEKNRLVQRINELKSVK